MKKSHFMRLCIVLSIALSSLLAASCAAGGREGALQSEETSPSAEPATAQATPVAVLAAEFTSRDADPSYDESTATLITLAGKSADVAGEGAAAGEGVVTIAAGGTYILTGEYSGHILVDAGDSDKVQIILRDASVEETDYPAIFIANADKVFLTLDAGTENLLADGAQYSLGEDDSNLDAAVFSRADLTVNGKGSLTVKGSFAHGIVSKDDLVITGGRITVEAAETGLCGKDAVKIAGGEFTISAGSDGIKSNNADDAGRGYVYISGGSFDITAGADGIQAETTLEIDGGAFGIVSGGGSANASMREGETAANWGSWGVTGEEESAKGLKAAGALIIKGGSFNIDSSDDSLHSNGSISVFGGEITASSGDDGLHADGAAEISGGTLNILKSYEGVEGASVTVSGGTLTVCASDDGINSAGGTDTSAENRPGRGGFMDGGGVCPVTISGGYILIDSGGDGIDANGELTVSGGVTVVNGPENSGNGALDYASGATVSGGLFIASGASGMAVGFSGSSSQCSFLYNGLSLEAGVRLTLADAKGKVLLSFIPAKNCDSVVMSAPGLAVGGTYTILSGGEASDADENGFASSGTLSGGAEAAEVTLESVSMTLGTASFGGFGGHDGFGGHGGGMAPAEGTGGGMAPAEGTGGAGGAPAATPPGGFGGKPDGMAPAKPGATPQA